MSAKVDTRSAVDPSSTKMSASTTPTSTQKVSMFAAKSGFVIPKNKLSGSLIPIFRGPKKPGGGDAADEETTKVVQRKTKWGPDLTQDAAVKRGRSLAYQVLLEFFHCSSTLISIFKFFIFASSSFLLLI
jgi:splicing factor 1